MKLWKFTAYIHTDEIGNKSYTDDGIIFASRIFDTLNKKQRRIHKR